MKLEALAKKLGIDAEVSGRVFTLSRGSVRCVVRAAESFDAERAACRQELFAVLRGIRLGADRVDAEYDFAEERPSAEGARNVYEIPPTYGVRFQTLVPALSRRVASRVCGQELLAVPWRSDDFDIVLVRELARHFHTLVEADLDVLPWSRENLVEYARYALFYDSYRTRPVESQEVEGGTLKWFRTTDGTAPSRATLLPDLDSDAAAAGGRFAIVDRNTFVVSHPASDVEAANAALRGAAHARWSEASHPFADRVWPLADKEDAIGAFGDEVRRESPGIELVEVLR